VGFELTTSAAFLGNCIRTNPIIIPATAIIRKNAAFAVISATSNSHCIISKKIEKSAIRS
jgi:hypothetical protein